MQWREDVREHRPSCSGREIDGLDRTGDSSNCGRIYAQDIDPTYQLGDNARPKRIFAGGDWSDQVASQFVGQPHIRSSKRIFKET